MEDIWDRTVFAKESEAGHLSEICLPGAESTWEPAFAVRPLEAEQRLYPDQPTATSLPISQPTTATRLPLALRRINAASSTSTGNFLRKLPKRLIIHNRPIDFQKKMSSLVIKRPRCSQSNTRTEPETDSHPIEPGIFLERNSILQSAVGTNPIYENLPTPTAANLVTPFSQEASPATIPLNRTAAKPIPEKQEHLQIGQVVRLPTPPPNPQDSPKPLRHMTPRPPPPNRHLHRTSISSPRSAPTHRIEKSLSHSNSDL